MNLFLKSIKLKNYCNYTDHTFSFIKPDGKPYRLIVFYGPNGIGKTNCLEAIAKMTMNTAGRNEEQIQRSLKKYVRNIDYDPLCNRLTGLKYENGIITGKKEDNLEPMFIEAVYEMDGNDYHIELGETGYLRNDFAPVAPDADEDEKSEIMSSGPWGQKHLLYRQRVTHFITSDSDLSMSKFQLHISQVNDFEKIVSAITRYKADCVSPSGTTPQDREYCTDFIITKGIHRIHYKRMSAGEKKICKSFSQVLNLIHDLEHPCQGEISMPGWPRILLLDNIVMHVYYDRHVIMADSIKKIFSKQQIFATTHSGTLIQRAKNKENDYDNELYIDLEKVIKEEE